MNIRKREEGEENGQLFALAQIPEVDQ